MMVRALAWPWWLAALAAVILALVCLALLLDSFALTNPPGYRQPDRARFVYPETPATAAGLAFEDITFAAPNGAVVRGWLVPAADDAKDLGVILLHGRGGDRRGALPYLSMLHASGAGVSAIDMRENGLSDGAGRGTALGMREAEDAAAAAADMRARGYRKVVLMGCSLGGVAAIIAAAHDPKVDGVIAESTIADFKDFVAEGVSRKLARLGLRAPWIAAAWGWLVVGVTRTRLALGAVEAPADEVGRIAPRPLLIIHGERDPWVGPENARKLAANAGAGALLWMISQAGHCDGSNVAPDEYRARVTEFLRAIRSPAG